MEDPTHNLSVTSWAKIKSGTLDWLRPPGAPWGIFLSICSFWGHCFLNFNDDSSLLVSRNTADCCILRMDPATYWVDLLLWFVCVCVCARARTHARMCVHVFGSFVCARLCVLWRDILFLLRFPHGCLLLPCLASLPWVDLACDVE